MVSTKKLLVAFNAASPKKKSSDFLIPWWVNLKPVFFGLRSGSQSDLGMVIYTGRSLGENDLLTKCGEIGMHISDPETMAGCFRDYLEQVRSLNIGNVVRIVRADDDQGRFHLEIVAKTPSFFDETWRN